MPLSCLSSRISAFYTEGCQAPTHAVGVLPTSPSFHLYKPKEECSPAHRLCLQIWTQDKPAIWRGIAWEAVSPTAREVVTDTHYLSVRLGWLLAGGPRGMEPTPVTGSIIHPFLASLLSLSQLLGSPYKQNTLNPYLRICFQGNQNQDSPLKRGNALL